MRQSPALQQIQNNMAPGAYTAHGFLGDDQRNLIDIIKSDEQLVAKLGVTHKQIASKMKEMTKMGIKTPDVPVIVQGKYEVLVDDHRGFIPCPFADNVKEIKRNTQVRNLASNDIVYWSDLNIHMIEQHGFYEGNGSIFRNDPTTLFSVLGLSSKKNL